MNKEVKLFTIASNIPARLVTIKEYSDSFKDNIIFKCVFSQNSKINNFVTDLSLKVLRKMKSGMASKDNRLIIINIAISDPINIDQANHLSSERQKVRMAASGAVAAPLKKVPYIGVPLGLAASAGVYKEMLEILPNAHEGDVIVSIEGIVSGGIGQQRSISAEIINRSMYDPI